MKALAAAALILASACTVEAHAQSAVGELVVTGSRTQGGSGTAGVAQVQVVDSVELSHVGQSDLQQILARTVPSLDVEAFGGDLGAMSLAARLRGLSANQTLVLVNGKRRHPTANLHVLGGQFQGAAAPDLDLIPAAAIDHIEVLDDGAAAQYGSDAIAGVINIVLKSTARGGVATVGAGGYYQGDGQTGDVSLNAGMPLGQAGFLNISGAYRYHGFSERGGPDARFADAQGNLLPGDLPQWSAIPGYPDVNHIVGDAESSLATLAINAGYDLGDFQAYGIGTFGRRTAQAYENYREPGRIVASPVLGVAAQPTDPGAIVYAPLGFNPREAMGEIDYALTLGLRGAALGWNIDLASTYGYDRDDIRTLGSANRALFIDTHFTPTDFYDGAFEGSQWTNDIDLTRTIDLGFMQPVQLALGAETRRDTYRIIHGDMASIYQEGPQAYPGFAPTDAGLHVRQGVSSYVDAMFTPLHGLRLDVAGRLEHYSDFGWAPAGKLSVRYDIDPAFALQAAIGNGFRAPSLPEEYYSATNVSPDAAQVQLPPDSAAARLMGFDPLRPEKSVDVSAGAIFRPAGGPSLSVEAYQIRVNDRVVGSGLPGAANSPLAYAAIAAHGAVVDPTVSFVGIGLFTNAMDTRTRGLDVLLDYASDLGRAGRIRWRLAASYAVTSIISIRDPPPALAGTPLFTPGDISYLTTASPGGKVLLDMLYTRGRWSLNLRERVYGSTSARFTPDGVNYYRNTVGAAAITDLEIGLRLAPRMELRIGADNLFNVTAPPVVLTPSGGLTDGSYVYGAPLTISPYGINGGAYYTTLSLSF